MKKLKKTYRYAIISALFLTILSVIFVWLSHLFLFERYGFIYIIVFAIALFVTSVFLIQYRAENFIYKRIKKLYEDISILDINDLEKNSVTTDIDKLTKNVQASVEQYIDNKHEQIADLTEKDSFRKEFLGNVSHELKTPLFTVQGYILTLLDGAINDKEVRDKYLKRANKGVERLTAIVKDLDMISKLESEGMEINIERFNIIELIQNVFDLLEMKAKKRDISLQFDKRYTPIFVKADIERIEQVLINLIVNSIKYGKIGGKTILKIENYNNNKILIKVIDNGKGIEQKHIPRLFERFYRVDPSRVRNQGGSGLGLSIVKHIIEVHNETLSLKSTYGKGSEFSFTLEKSK